MKRPLSVLMALLLVAAGCAKKSEVASRAASLVPSNALAYVTISLDPSAEQKRTLKTLCAKFKKLGESDCDVARLLDELFGDIGLSYGNDVKPWIGEELSFAVLPPSRSGGEPLVVVLVEARDTDAAGEKLKAAKGKDAEVDYRVAGNYVVIAGQEGTADRTAALEAIEAQSAGDRSRSLGGDSRFTSLAAKVRSPHLALGWWDVARTLEVMGSKVPIPGFGGLLDLMKGAGGALAMALYAEPDGLALEGVVDAGKAASGAPAQGGVPALTEGLPGDTLAALTMFGIGGHLGEAAAQGGAGTQLEDAFDQVRAETGLDVEQDLLSWMDGEIVVAAGPPHGSPFPQVGLVVEPTDKAKAAAGVEKIKAAVEKVLGAPLTPVDVGGTKAYVLTQVPLPGVAPAMALFPDRFVVASTPDYLAALSKPASPSSASFGSTAEYKRIAGSGVKGGEVAVQLVVRLGAVRDAVVGFMEGDDKAGYDKDVAPWLELLQALLLRVAPGDNGTFELKITTTR